MVMKASKCKTCSKAAKNSREVTGAPNGQEQTNAKDPEKPSKIVGEEMGHRNNNSTTLILFGWVKTTVLYSAPPIPVRFQSFWRNPVESTGFWSHSTGFRQIPLE